MNELMDRLARANPTQADEPLTAEEQREADALLVRILADSPTVTAPKRAPTLPGRARGRAPRRAGARRRDRDRHCGFGGTE